MSRRIEGLKPIILNFSFHLCGGSSQVIKHDQIQKDAENKQKEPKPKMQSSFTFSDIFLLLISKMI